MAIVTLGIDLAKNVFALHGVDATGKAALVRPSVARAKLLELVASLPPCLIGMEACSGAHHWARLFRTYGHTVKLMAPKFVTPYRLSGKRGKNDAADAAAICEAVIGPVTASALLASIGNGRDFKNGRQVAAWIGLVPGQYSSGGKTRLGRISKAGDNDLRSLLVMGARAILSGLGDKQDGFSRWARNLLERRGYWRAGVAVAAKNARLAWAVLHYGEDFRLNPGVT